MTYSHINSVYTSGNRKRHITDKEPPNSPGLSLHAINIRIRLTLKPVIYEIYHNNIFDFVFRLTIY